MNKFRKPHGSAGRRSNAFHGGSDNRRPGGGGFDKKMYPAVCAECGNACEVPFRPNGKRPVYCLNCFGKNERSESKFTPSRNFGDRPVNPPTPSFTPRVEDRRIDDIVRKLDMIYSKLDGILQALTAKKKAPEAIKAAPAEKKTASKKASAKKK